MSSEPLPIRMLSGSTSSTRPAAWRKVSPSGCGYLRRLFEVSAARIASNTRGLGGYGFSFVFSLTMSGSLSCSPGTYPAIARMFGRTVMAIGLAYFFAGAAPATAGTLSGFGLGRAAGPLSLARISTLAAWPVSPSLFARKTTSPAISLKSRCA